MSVIVNGDTPPVVPAAPVEPITDWRTSIPDAYKTDKVWEPYKDKPLGDVLKGYAEGAKLIGRKEGVKPLTDKSTPEEIAAWRMAAGVPAASTDYQIQRPEVANDGAWSQEDEAAFLGVMHKAGAPPGVVQAALSWYGEFVANQQMANQREAQTAAAALRKEWGPNFEANLGRANRVLQEFGGDDAVRVMQDTGLGRHPAIVKMMAKVGNALVEHGAMETTSHTSMEPTQAQERINAIRSDPKHPFNNANDPGHMDAIDLVMGLRRVAVGRENRVVAELP